MRNHRKPFVLSFNKSEIIFYFQEMELREVFLKVLAFLGEPRIKQFGSIHIQKGLGKGIPGRMYTVGKCRGKEINVEEVMNGLIRKCWEDANRQ